MMPIQIYPEHKVIYIGHDKCASENIRGAFGINDPLRKPEPIEPGLLGTPVVRSKVVNLYKYPDYYMMTFIRNPYDRMVSAYYYALQWGVKYKSFEHFLKWPRKKWLGSFHVYEYDFIGRYENLYDDFNCFLALRNIPIPDPHPLDAGFRNKGKLRPKKHYREHYTDELRSIVARQYARDLKMFNYSF
jgi:hypothetical protein